jgi:hypothetical protein
LGGDPEVICNGGIVGLGDGDGDGDIVGVGEGLGGGVGLPVISSHQYVCPVTTGNAAVLPGKVAMLPEMLVSNSVSKSVFVAPSNVSNASDPLA